METVSDIDRLHFYRSEVKHEFNLLTTRVGTLVTCQSFLVVPFAILNTVANFKEALPSLYLVAALGLFVAAVLLEPIRAGHRTLTEWLRKQRTLLRESEGLQDLAIERDMIPGAETDLSKDRDHTRSLAFSKYGPYAFILFWIGSIVCATLRAWPIS